VAYNYGLRQKGLRWSIAALTRLAIMKRRFMESQRRHGPTVAARRVRTAIHTWKLVGTSIMLTNAYQSSRKCLAHFLFHCDKNFDFRFRLRYAFFVINYTQERWRNLSKIMKERREAFGTRVLFYQTHLVITDLARCDYSQLLVEKCQNLSDEHQDLMAEIFVTMARLEFKAEYLTW